MFNGSSQFEMRVISSVPFVVYLRLGILIALL